MSFIQQQEEFDHVAGYSPSDKFAGYDRGELQARYTTYVECATDLGWPVIKTFEQWLES